MQSTKNFTNQTVHFKVLLNDEYRRFSLENLSFGLLEQTIRKVYSLTAEEALKICFYDDEQDLVLMTTDNELIYALELIGQKLVRLKVQIAANETAACPDAPPFLGHCGQNYDSECWGKRAGRGRGGREVWKEEKRKWREERAALSPEERLKWKTERITERIVHLESVLQKADELPANRKRALNWRLEKLQAKLEKVQAKHVLDTNAPSSPTPVSDFENPEPNEQMPFYCFKGRRGGWGGPGSRGGFGGPNWGGPGSRGGFGGPHWGGPHCGRGGWGGSRGGCGGENVCPETPLVDPDQIWEDVYTCRMNLIAAKESGNQEEIQKCLQTLKELKAQKRAAKGMKRACKKGLILDEKGKKLECWRNLREARSSGDPEKIKQAEEALAAAKQALKQAKADIRLNKQ